MYLELRYSFSWIYNCSLVVRHGDHPAGHDVLFAKDVGNELVSEPEPVLSRMSGVFMFLNRVYECSYIVMKKYPR
mgnify:CR=1 FL=1